MGSPGVGFQADVGQAAIDQVGRYWIFFSRAKKQATPSN
jgi:hypothetical protein